jgi:hypothetical protein
VTWATAIFLAFLVLLFLGAVGCQLLGYRLGTGWRNRGNDRIGEGASAVEGSLFALLGLLIAFTISGGEARLDVRRRLIVEEANAIETAYLRLDLLPAPAQPALRDQFRRYTDARIMYFRTFPHLDEARALNRRAIALQRQIWQGATAAALERPDTRAAIITLPAINTMIDVTTARDAALLTHVPMALFALLIPLAFICSFIAGVGMSKSARPSPVYIVAFAGTLALTCYAIVNLEFPRLGFVRLAPFDALLAEVRQRMG